MSKKRVAVAGGGIAGLVAAYLLRDVVDVVLYEADGRLGGHANTVDTEVGGEVVPTDTAVVVFNPRTYPLFVKLLDHLDVTPVETAMALSVRDDERGVEYGTHFPRAFLKFWPKLFTRLPYELAWDLPRFVRAARRHANDPVMTLGELLDRYRLGEALVDHIVLPLTAMVWSVDFARCREVPFAAWWSFVMNHGLATPGDFPQWHAFPRGTRAYVEKLGAALGDRVRSSSPVTRIARAPDGVWVSAAGGEPERYDEVIVALHADVAAKVLEGATEAEASALREMTFEKNESLLHSDPSVMPRDPRVWSQWNYRMYDRGYRAATVTYDMNKLQGFQTAEPLLVSMNQVDRIDPAKVRARFTYEHPRYTVRSLAARDRLIALSGRDRIHFTGCYLGIGFHEDGIRRSVEVARALGAQPSFL